MTYANVSTGFRGGGFNPYNVNQTPTIRAFDPEKATSYEAGARLQFLDRRTGSSSLPPTRGSAWRRS